MGEKKDPFAEWISQKLFIAAIIASVAAVPLLFRFWGQISKLLGFGD
jgi:hypothetical protein